MRGEAPPPPLRFGREERPNTVSGLKAKRAELQRVRRQMERDLRTITCDLDHLDAAIKLFDPELTPKGVRRYMVRHRAKKGTVKRFILGMLREAPEPITSLTITEAWVADRGMRADGETVILIRKRIGASLIALRNAGLAGNVERPGIDQWWVRVE